MDQFSIEDSRERTGGLPTPRGRRSEQVRARGEARLFRAVETAFAVSRNDLCAVTRGRCGVAIARQTGMYLARVTLGMTLSGAGLLFGRDRTTASHACRLVEDLRDDPRFDALLEAMEVFILCSDGRSRSAHR
jgi:hypothetical protein